jgi:thiamine-phosphate pyrophosphorylase
VPTLEAAARRLKPARHGRGRVPRLFLFGDRVRLPDPCAAAARLPPGAAVVARGLADAVLRQLAELARRRRLVLLQGSDGRAALRLAGRHPGLIAGLHLPDRGGTPGLLAFLLARRARAQGARPLLLTAAAHGRSGVARARRLRAAAVILSPVFPTPSHPGGPTLGPCRWAVLARQAGHGTSLPVVALGGIGPGNAGRLPRWAAGLAGITGLAG